jgi:hypothetical protein
VGEPNLTRRSLAVQRIRPGSQELADEIARLLGAERVGTPPRNAGIGPTTPDVLVLIDSDP